MQSQYYSLPGVSSYHNFFGDYALAIDPSSWPNLQINFGEFTVQIPPSVYFLYTIQNGITYWYLGIYSVDSSVKMGGISDISMCCWVTRFCEVSFFSMIVRMTELE